jgi:hypothetical protein
MMADKTKYMTVLHQGGVATWFVLDKPPAGLLQTATRMKIGSHYYFLCAEKPLVDAASGTTLIFVQALTHHGVCGHNINPEGTVYELTKVDPNDFRIDASWREIENPFTAEA